ncbi:pyridoxal-phosphate dependent enzyme, partial [Aduncisulcus paluster]
MKYICKSCSRTYEANPSTVKCDCGSALWLDFEGRMTKDDIIQNDFTMWRYSKAYPVRREDVKVTYGEGLTPLANIVFNGQTIQVKQDHLMPTGSFKDRGVAMVTNFLAGFGVNKFAEDSSGNGGS